MKHDYNGDGKAIYTPLAGLLTGSLMMRAYAHNARSERGYRSLRVRAL